MHIETKGGAQYTQAIDVCLDHACEHSKKLIKNTLEKDGVDTNIIPDQVDHILTSNWIHINKSSSISEEIVQIDPRYTRMQVSPIDNDLVTMEDLNHVKKNKYSDMSIKKTKDGFLVENPSFGSNYMVVAQKERKLGGFSHDLKPIVDQYNGKVKKQIIDSPLIAINEDVTEYNAIVDQSNESLSKLNSLYNTLLNSTKPGFLEALFNTKGYRIKCEARNIIVDSHQTLLELSENPENLAHHTDVLLDDLKFKLQCVDHGVPHTLIQKLNLQIEETQLRTPSIKMCG